MTRRLKKGMILFILIVIFGVLLISSDLVDAKFLDGITGRTIWERITGRAPSQSVGLSVKLDSAPIIGNVTTYNLASGLTVLEAGNTSIFFSFIVTDADGSSDIVNNSATANITRGGETTRYNDTTINPSLGGCRAQEQGVNFKNFTCNISVVFYDGAGVWNISVRINDTIGAFGQNTTRNFTINELKAIQINPSSILFPTILLSAVNTTAASNITVNNTGNAKINGREFNNRYLNLTAITLVGESIETAQDVIPTNNFTVGTTLDLGPAPAFCDTSRVQNTTRLANTTATPLGLHNNFSGMINGSHVIPGASNNFQVISFCLLEVGNITAQNYSTLKSGSWTILVF